MEEVFLLNSEDGNILEDRSKEMKEPKVRFSRGQLRREMVDEALARGDKVLLNKYDGSGRISTEHMVGLFGFHRYLMLNSCSGSS